MHLIYDPKCLNLEQLTSKKLNEDILTTKITKNQTSPIEEHNKHPISF